MKTALTWLNSGNKTAEIQLEYLRKTMGAFSEPIVACEVGSAYGGGAEAMGRLLGDKGTVYGFDTFDGHPKDLADDRTSLEATCMDHWYHPDVLGRTALDITYQQKVLEKEDIHNVILVKGRVHKSSFDFIPKIHFVLMDLDLIKSTEAAYEGVKDKVVSGGYFIMHDSLPPDHLPMIYDFVYNKMLKDGRWYLEKESLQGLCTVMKRK